jgi:hypothetical protein
MCPFLSSTDGLHHLARSRSELCISEDLEVCKEGKLTGGAYVNVACLKLAFLASCV